MSKGASDYLHSNIALRMFLVRTLVAIDRECARQGRMISFECHRHNRTSSILHLRNQ
jgi:hypothetical protein